MFRDATAQSILWSKIPYFFRAIVVLGSVSLPRLNTPRKLSVKQQTMSGLSGSTNCTKVLKLSVACGQLPRGCSKLGKTRIIAKATAARIRNTRFCD